MFLAMMLLQLACRAATGSLSPPDSNFPPFFSSSSSSDSSSASSISSCSLLAISLRTFCSRAKSRPLTKWVCSMSPPKNLDSWIFCLRRSAASNEFLISGATARYPLVVSSIRSLRNQI